MAKISEFAFQLKTDIDRQILKLKMQVKQEEMNKISTIPVFKVNTGFLNTQIQSKRIKQIKNVKHMKYHGKNKNLVIKVIIFKVTQFRNLSSISPSSKFQEIILISLLFTGINLPCQLQIISVSFQILTLILIQIY